MDRLENFARTYSQAPWRQQLQMIGLFFAALVFFALVAGIYLNVSARAATAGREIQEIQKTAESVNREIEDLQSRLAVVNSSSEMKARASEMGFESVESDHMVYLIVPGYLRRQSPMFAPYSERAVVGAPSVPPEYTESLFSWIRRQASRMQFYFFKAKR